MNVSLTQELEDFITQEVATGHYKSASEVIREALRNHIRRGAEHQLDMRIKSSQAQASRGEVVNADADFFQRKRDMIHKQYLGEAQSWWVTKTCDTNTGGISS